MSKGRDPASATALESERDGSKDVSEAEWKQRLTTEQYDILRKKRTDPRNIGYDNHYEKDGVYYCAGCQTALYKSEHKFDCGCGWPGFWTNISKAVREVPEGEGRPVEIVCNACNGHLGHVFRREGFSRTNPPPNERHCVNSTALVFRK